MAILTTKIIGAYIALFLAVPSLAFAQQKCGNIQFNLRELPTQEDRASELSLLDANQRLIVPRMLVPGRAIPLCKFGVLLLLDDSSLHFPGPSFLIDSTGQPLASFDFGDIAAYHVDLSERLFWVQSFVFVPPAGAPVADYADNYVTRLWVVDRAGKVLVHEDFRIPTVYKLDFDGEIISIDIIKPDLPN